MAFLGWAIFADQAAFDTWVAGVDSALGYPNATTKTDTYASAIEHPESDDDRVLTGIDTECPEGNRPADLKTHAEAETEGWFPGNV